MSHLTQIEGVPDRDSIPRGMAHFPGTGPPDATCGMCVHFRYKRTPTITSRRDASGQPFFKPYSVSKCAKYKRLTGRHGANINPLYLACRHFEPRIGNAQDNTHAEKLAGSLQADC